VERTGFFALWVNGDPRLDPLRADQRMTDLLQRMDLPCPVGALTT
jgi:hypothetical protein